MRDKHYKVEKGTNDSDLRFAWQLTCNGKHLQWFSDEVIARRTCDELNARKLLKEEQMVIDIKQYLKETNSVLLTEQAYKYLKEKASVIEKLEGIKTEMDIIAELEAIKAEFEEIKDLRDNPYNNKTEYSVSMKELRELFDKHIAELKGE